MIVLFTDYGLTGPYLGEVEAVLFRYAPSEHVLTLFADVPRQDPKSGAYLLAAYSREFPAGTIFFCVVDPGVGSGRDKPVVIKMDGHWFVGPHNGLFDIVTRQGGDVACWEITWKPERLSMSFHGRDLYGPVCSMIANQQPIPGKKIAWSPRYDWPDDLYKIIYVDHFGNGITGIRAGQVDREAVITIGTHRIKNANTFADVGRGELFWYENSSGLVEVAVNWGSAAELLSMAVGDEVGVFVGV